MGTVRVPYELVEKLKKLIKKKKSIKQGAMQELLTGKRRLSGFSGGWVEKEASGRVKAELVDARVPYPFIRPCQQEWCGGRVRWRGGRYDD